MALATNSLHRAVLAMVAVLAFGSVSFAQTAPAAIDPELLEKIRNSNAECYACHTEQGVTQPVRADMDLAKLGGLLLEDADFKLSGHGRMECKTCHGASYNAFPHAEGARAKISPCEECHAVKVMRIEQQYHSSVHAKNLADKFTCKSCHDPHLFNVAAKIGSPRAIVAQDNAMCLDCHNSDLRFAELGVTMTPRKARPDIDKIHDWLPNTKAHWESVRCIECHTPVSPTKSLAMSHEIVAKDKAEKNCVTCHSQKTALRTRLYRHVAETEAAQYGFVNSAVMGSAYVIGATRNSYVDQAALVLIGLTVAGLAGHGLLRLVLAFIRRRRSS